MENDKQEESKEDKEATKNLDDLYKQKYDDLKAKYDKSLADNKSLLNFALGKMGKKDDGKDDPGFKSTDMLEDEDQQAIADKRKKEDNDIVEAFVKTIK